MSKTKSTPTKYRVIELPAHNHKLDEPTFIGEIVYRLDKYDYGVAYDDSCKLGTECISVTRKEDGDYPSISLPKYCLEVVAQVESTVSK